MLSWSDASKSTAAVAVVGPDQRRHRQAVSMVSLQPCRSQIVMIDAVPLLAELLLRKSTPRPNSAKSWSMAIAIQVADKGDISVKFKATPHLGDEGYGPFFKSFFPFQFLSDRNASI